MMKQSTMSLMVCLCVASGSMTACDGTDEYDDPSASDALAIAEPAALELGMWPAPELASEPITSTAFEGEIAPAILEQEAVPAGHHHHHHPRVKKPKPGLMIGWLEWALAQPWNEGPINDPTGEGCGIGQQGPVWYLAGTSGGPATRECDVPVGKKLFFPLINRWCVFPEEYYPTEESIEEAIPYREAWLDDQYANTCDLTLRIDGQEVLSFDELYEDLYIRVDELFEVDVHDEHWAPEYFSGGSMPMIADGNYALIPPLPPGDHVIEFGGEICGDYPFETSVTYVLHVGP